MIYITNSAKKYLKKLLSKKKNNTQIKITITHPGTPYAECKLSYYLLNTKKTNEIELKFKYFSIYINKTHIPYLKNAKIDLIKKESHLQLMLKAPNIKKENKNNTKKNDNLGITPTFIKKIKTFLQTYINPKLLYHGGQVEAIKIDKNMQLIVKFSGNCNGCSMVSYTLKEGIEKTLLKFFPKLKGIKDLTKHKNKKHYSFKYKPNFKL
ncbi:Fe/S biogenesis protein NfuA [Candidatus Westeberhardia cardiocondylae]|uniref:Fe/S biogenesis protein NfuA n=1 Tax=Candidatus Westeberhardia cardiocondylae TaxID=1594731 RepID=A0A0H5BWF7_9ENTR|nr:NifU family protein [Candidatus Westeberhardia cardiocondylae]CEN32022.1 Fe/S biogenesis protein NfuA [Candidatus Westeberhardia cardiocondylae]